MLYPIYGMYHGTFDNIFKIFNLQCIKKLCIASYFLNLDSLVCRCPFVGETDRATLLRVGEGTLNWDAPDVTCRSPEAQNFLHMLLQPDPE